jgi:transposase-like protein
MLISLHKQATTTPKVRAAIQASDEPAWKVAERYGISGQTVWKWRNRDSTEDRSHTPHRLQTTLTPAQDAGRWRSRCAEPFFCRSTTCSPWSARF